MLSSHHRQIWNRCQAPWLYRFPQGARYAAGSPTAILELLAEEFCFGCIHGLDLSHACAPCFSCSKTQMEGCTVEGRGEHVEWVAVSNGCCSHLLQSHQAMKLWISPPTGFIPKSSLSSRMQPLRKSVYLCMDPVLPPDDHKAALKLLSK